jgi:hypothetical protein
MPTHSYCKKRASFRTKQEHGQALFAGAFGATRAPMHVSQLCPTPSPRLGPIGVGYDTFVIAPPALDRHTGRTHAIGGCGHYTMADTGARNMTSRPSSHAIGPPSRRVGQSSSLSPGWMKFLASWFFGWPLLVFTYNPLAAPYDPLTLLIVIPGGAIWLLSCGLGCTALFAMAEARWPAMKTVREVLGPLLYLIMQLLCCIP